MCEGKGRVGVGWGLVMCVGVGWYHVCMRVLFTSPRHCSGFWSDTVIVFSTGKLLCVSGMWGDWVDGMGIRVASCMHDGIVIITKVLHDTGMWG